MSLLSVTSPQLALSKSSTISRSTSSFDSELSGSRTISLDSISTTGKSPKGSVRYKWTSKWEIVAMHLACFITFENFFIIPTDVLTDDPATIVHYVLFFVLIGVPAVYMQTIIGQYSQLGVLFFKYLCPIGHGIGFVLCVNTFWDCINVGVVMGDVLLYLLSAMKSELPWMKCPDDDEKCWNFNNNCTRNCLTSEKQISAFVFWREVYMENVDLNATVLKYSAPIVARVIVVGITWGIVYGLTHKRINNYKGILIVNLYIASLLCLLLMFASIFASGGTKAFLLFINADWNYLLDIEIWSSVTGKGMQFLGLGKACYIVYGSYMDFKMPSNILTVSYVFLNLFLTLLGCVIIFACVGVISEESNTPVEELKHIFKQPAALFTILPQSFGYLGVSQLWSTAYFIMCFLLIVNHQVTEIEIVERCIADLDYRFKYYTDYVIMLLCLFGFIFGTLLVSKDSFLVHSQLNDNVVSFIQSFAVAIMYTLISWVYGVQKISDDIHFMFGTQPVKFWKSCWYSIPAVLWITLIQTSGYFKSTEFFVILFIFGIAYISPLPIMAGIATFQYLKHQNFIGLVQAQERWGPPDPQERYLRHVYNPREETHSRKKNPVCRHECFLRSNILMQAIEEQEFRRMDDNYDLKVREGEGGSGNNTGSEEA